MSGNAALRFALTVTHRPTVEALEGRTLLSGGAPGTIRGLVFNDADENGRRSRPEVGVGDASAFIDANANGSADAGEATVITAGDGTFEFAGLAAGTHAVGVIPPADMRAGPGGNTTHAVVTARRGGRLRPIGLVGLGTIGGTVFSNSVYPPPLNVVYDKPVRNMRVFLDANDDGVRQRGEPLTRTDAEGRYRFSSLTAGSYVVKASARGPWHAGDVSPARADITAAELNHVRNLLLTYIPRWVR